MDVDPGTGLPMSFAPVTPDVQKKNEFQTGRTFPFGTWRSLPSFPNSLLNVSISVGTLAVSVGCLAVSVFVFLPIGLLKTVGEAIRSVLRTSRGDDTAAKNGRRRCIVINGAR